MINQERLLPDEFFPTPAHVVEGMIAPLRGRWSSLPFKSVLDPSAGRGDILDHVKKDDASKYGSRSMKLHAIEIDDGLRHQLRGKEYQPIARDFLSYSLDRPIDLIVMNPPFSVGAKHLLHAWDILESGSIVCLLNENTLNNPFSIERKLLLQIIDQHGRYEMWGPVFDTAARKTKVGIACVWLEKKQTKKEWSINETRLEGEMDVPLLNIDIEQETGLISSAIIAGLVELYQASKAQLENKYQARAAFVRHSSRLSRLTASVMEKSHDNEEESVASLSKEYWEEAEKLRRGFWAHVLTKTQLMKRTTSNFHKTLESAEGEAQSIAFTEDNIKEVLAQFLLNWETIWKDCFIETFKKVTNYHPKNTIHTEGWKSNSSYKVNKRIILPREYGWGYSWGGWSFRSYNDRFWEFLEDLDKMVCFATNLNIEDIDGTAESISKHCDQINSREVEYDDKFKSTFFEIRIFKKGTVHLTWLDKKDNELFNRKAAEFMSGLPSEV